LAKEHSLAFQYSSQELGKIADIIDSLSSLSGCPPAAYLTEADLSTKEDNDGEVVHENEQEAQEEAEEEAEEEEEKVSAYTRDDEQPIPWSAQLLTQKPTLSHKDPFYPLAAFQVFHSSSCC
jgi:hypothetical protein